MNNSHIRQAARIPAAALAFFCVSMLAPAAYAGLFGTTEVKAAWSEADAKVDGSVSEWSGADPTGKSGLGVLAANDGKAVYLYVSALDSDADSQLRGRYKQTITLWLDGAGGKKKAYGIKLTPRQPEMKREKGEKGEKPSAPPSGDSSRDRNSRQARSMPVSSYTAVLVNGDGEERPLGDDGVLFAAALDKKKRTVFELSLPLAALGSPAETVGFGVETSEIDASAMPQRPGGSGAAGGSDQSRGSGGRMGGGPPPGGMNGGPGGGGPPPGGMGGGPGGGAPPSGGQGGGPGGGMGGEQQTLPDAIGFWVKVKLAAN